MEYPSKTEPYEHQLREMREGVGEVGRGLFWEPGCGKTKPVVDTAAHLYLNDDVNGLLVVAPSGVHDAWVLDEVPTHLRPDVEERTEVHAWRTPSAKTMWHRRRVSELVAHPGLSVLCMNVSGLMTEEGRRSAKDFLTARRCMFVVDESQLMKTPGSKRTRRLMAAKNYAAYRRVLTGTVVHEGPFDVYSQLKFARPDVWDEYGCRTFDAFKARYGVWERGYANGRHFPSLVNYRNLDELGRAIESVGSRVRKDQVLDLPPKIYHTRYFDLSPAQSRVYDELERDLRSEIRDGDVVTAEASIAIWNRFRQVTKGFARVEDGRVSRFDENPREAALIRVLEEFPGPKIVWCEEDPEVEDVLRVLRGLGVTHVRYDGAVSGTARIDAKRAFQRDGTAEVFVSKPSVGGPGLTLHRAKTVVYYSNSWSMGSREQSENRPHRPGMGSEPLNCVDIVARGTVDVRQIGVVLQKCVVAGKVYGDPLGGRIGQYKWSGGERTAAEVLEFIRC